MHKNKNNVVSIKNNLDALLCKYIVKWCYYNLQVNKTLLLAYEERSLLCLQLFVYNKWYESKGML